MGGRRGSSLQPATLRRFLGLRMIVLALVVGTGIMIMQLGGDGVSVRPLYLLLAIGCAVGGMFFVALRAGTEPRLWVWTLISIDILIETALIHYSGGITSQFSLIYCLSIIGAAFLLSGAGGLGIAALASVLYAAYGVLQSNGIVGGAIEGGDYGQIGFLKTYMHVSVFFMVGAIGGFLADRMQHRGQQLQSARSELKELRVSTDRILRHMSSGVLVIDSEGKIITINPTAEEILEVDRADVESMDAEAAFGSLMPHFAEELLGALRSEEGRSRLEMTVRKPGGVELPIGISISLLKNNEDQREGVIAVFQDLTVVRDMQEKVRRADRLAAIGELSAGIAHEIRNPLASISGSIEVLSGELELIGENKRLMDLVTRESERLDRIITDFLEFARMRPPARDHVAISDCIDDVLTLMRNDAVFVGEVDIEVAHQTTNLTARVDEEQFKQVLLNIGMNACEAMGGRGKLRITTRLDEEVQLRIAFEDEGPGFEAQARTRVFEPFFTTKDGGTGLGLALANKIVEAHGGRMEVSDRKEGGAIVAVILPPGAIKQSSHAATVGSIG